MTLRRAHRWSIRWLAGVMLALHAAGGGAAQVLEPHASRLDRSGLVQTFSEDFDTLRVADPRDRASWTPGRWKTWYPHGLKPMGLHARTLPANSESQVYVDAHWPTRAGSFPTPGVTASKGVLHLRADRVPASLRGRIHGRSYTSGMVSSWGMFTQRYGVFEARIKLPKGRGLWPAFWMLRANGGWPPEIDIMEHLGHDVHSTWVVTHYRKDGKHRTTSREVRHAKDMTQDFHVYTVDWGPRTITFYVDDLQVMQMPTPDDLHEPMYLILNLAVGGRWGGPTDATTVLPATMQVDWVRAWRRG